MKLERGVEVVVGTPGRLIDLQERGILNATSLRAFILDETDQMLNFGFQEDIERILENAKKENQENYDKVQFLLFSATVPPWVDKIAAKFMK